MCREQGEALERQFPMVHGFHLGLHGLAKLRAEPFWRFILRYNGTRISGRDLLSELESQGVAIPEPTRELAKSRVGWMRTNLEGALTGNVPKALFPHLPDDELLVTRKLARNFVVLEGAHLLMAQGQFAGFAQDAVLSALNRRHGQWGPVVSLTRETLRDPIEAGVAPMEFMTRIEAFCRWTIDCIEKA